MNVRLKHKSKSHHLARQLTQHQEQHEDYTYNQVGGGPKKVIKKTKESMMKDLSEKMKKKRDDKVLLVFIELFTLSAIRHIKHINSFIKAAGILQNIQNTTSESLYMQDLKSEA